MDIQQSQYPDNQKILPGFTKSFSNFYQCLRKSEIITIQPKCMDDEVFCKVSKSRSVKLRSKLWGALYLPVMRNNCKTETLGHFITQVSTLKKKKLKPQSPCLAFSLPGTETAYYRVLGPRCIFFNVCGANGLQNKHQRILHLKTLSTGTSF